MAWSGLSDSKTKMSRVQVGRDEGQRLLTRDHWREQKKERCRERAVPSTARGEP